jgi:hypothetical protein
VCIVLYLFPQEPEEDQQRHKTGTGVQGTVTVIEYNNLKGEEL